MNDQTRATMEPTAHVYCGQRSLKQMRATNNALPISSAMVMARRLCTADGDVYTVFRCTDAICVYTRIGGEVKCQTVRKED